jgi:hypothetical protein
MWRLHVSRALTEEVGFHTVEDKEEFSALGENENRREISERVRRWKNILGVRRERPNKI